MFKKVIATASIATIALIGTAGVAHQLNNVTDGSFLGTTLSSNKNSARADSEYTFDFAGRELISVGTNEFTYAVFLRDLNESDGIELSDLKDDIDNKTGTYLSDFQIQYNIDDETKTTIWSESTDPSTPYVSILAYDDWDNNSIPDVEEGVLHSDITIHDPSLVGGTRVSGVELIPNATFGGFASSIGMDIVLDVLDEDGNPITLEGIAGDTINGTSAYFNMPGTSWVYIVDSLEFGDVTSSSIDFSFQLGGEYDVTKSILPTVAYEDPEHDGKQRLMSTSLENYEESTDGDGNHITTYEYTIDGVANAVSGNKENLTANKTYDNIRVYLDLDPSNITGAFLNEDVYYDDSLNSAGETITTTAKSPIIDSFNINEVTQTTVDFYIDFAASGIVTSTETITSKGDSEYGLIDEANLEVAYRENSSIMAGKDAASSETVDIDANNWLATDDNLIRGEFTVAGLNPETNYDILADVDTTIGAPLTHLTTFKTEDYDPYDILEVVINGESYTTADVSVSMNDAGVYDVDNFSPTKIRAYYNTEAYDGDQSIFTPENRLSITYNEATSTDTKLDFTISGLNPDSINEGVTYSGVRFVYSDSGFINPESVSDPIEIKTSPLEPVEIGVDGITGNFDVVETGKTINTVNISVPELSSADFLAPSATFENGAYQKINYGPTGNLQFAVKPQGSHLKETNADGYQILTKDDVIINGPTSFVLKLDTLLANEKANTTGTGSGYLFDLQIGTLASDGSWVWTNADEQISTTQLESPDVTSIIVDESSATQNDINITIDVKHAPTGSTTSTYGEFDPMSDIEFKGSSLYNEDGEYLTFDYDETQTVEEVTDGEEVISTYEYTLHNLRAETHYTAIQTSIQGAEYIIQPSSNFDTLNKSMVEFKMQDESGNNLITKSSQTYDSITFEVEATTGGNYKSLTGEDYDDLSIWIVNGSGSNLSVEDFTIESINTSEGGSSSTGGSYDNTSEEVTSTYEVTMNGLSGLRQKTTEIKQISIIDNSGDVFGENVKQTNNELNWFTTPRKNAQFADGYNMEILTQDGDDGASQGFEFTFYMNYGGEFLDFDPTSASSSINFYAKEGSHSYYSKYDVKFIEELEISKGENTHKLKYSVSGLIANTTYSDITIVIGDSAPGAIGNEALGKELTYKGTYTTSALASPVLAESFYVNSNDITNDSFIFSISVIKGAESASINDQGYDVFKPSFATLGYKNDSLQDVDLETKEISNFETEDELSKSTEYDTYKFEVTGLTHNTTYDQLYFKYNAKNTSKVELTGKSVTTKSAMSPFDPVENPVDFDYDSITDNSFEFSMYVYSNEGYESSDIDSGSVGYFGFAANETYVRANSSRLKTDLISVEDTYINNKNSDELIKYTYEVTNLSASTRYTDFSLTINSRNGDTEDDSDTVVYEKVTYNIPYAYILTHNDLTKIYAAAGVSATFSLLIILILIVWYIMLWYRRHIALSIYGDPASVEAGTVIFKILNGRKHKEFRNTPLDEMRLYVGTKEIPSIFQVQLDGHGEPTDHYQIVTRDVVGDNELILALLAGSKYDTFDISLDGGATVQHIPTIKNKKVSKVALSLGSDKKYEAAIKKYSKKNKSDMKENEGGSMIFFNRHLTTSNSIRYEAILPNDHPVILNKDTLIPNFVIYYQVDKQLYPFEMKHLGNEGAVYSWDLVGLEPSTAYVNTHFSFDGGKTMIPSLTNYGVTRNENEKQVRLEDAELAAAPLKKAGKGKGIDLEKGFELPKLKKAVEYLGPKVSERMIEVSVQKHIQRDEGKWIPHKKIGTKFNEYLSEWYSDVDSLKYGHELKSFILDWADEDNERKLLEVIGAQTKTKKTTKKVNKGE